MTRIKFVFKVDILYLQNMCAIDPYLIIIIIIIIINYVYCERKFHPGQVNLDRSKFGLKCLLWTHSYFIHVY